MPRTAIWSGCEPSFCTIGYESEPSRLSFKCDSDCWSIPENEENGIFYLHVTWKLIVLIWRTNIGNVWRQGCDNLDSQEFRFRIATERSRHLRIDWNIKILRETLRKTSLGRESRTRNSKDLMRRGSSGHENLKIEGSNWHTKIEKGILESGRSKSSFTKWTRGYSVRRGIRQEMKGPGYNETVFARGCSSNAGYGSVRWATGIYTGNNIEARKQFSQTRFANNGW